MARSEARQAAMQLIFANMLGGEGGDSALSDLLGFLPSGDDAGYVQQVVGGVRANQDELDGRIERHLHNWALDRLARVDLAILRLAAYEIMYLDDVPDAVAVNEAVELSHVFSTDESGGFINGVLGSLIRSMEQQT